MVDRAGTPDTATPPAAFISSGRPAPLFTIAGNEVAGHEITATPGLVRGNTVRDRHVGRNITQGLRNLADGELIRAVVTIYR